MRPNTIVPSPQHLQSEVLEAIARGEPLRAVAEHLCRRVEELIPEIICTIIVIEDGRLRPLAAPSLPASYSAALDGIPIGPSVGCCGTAAYRGETVIVTDIETDPLWAPYKQLTEPLGLKACWSTPIKARDERVVGTFAFYYCESRAPNLLEKLIVQTCVHLCAIAIEREEVRARNHRLAYYDTLTQLPNRAHFNETINELATDQPHNVGLLLIDIDNLKAVNDTLGHQAGDALIEAVGTRLNEVDFDGTAFRLGGDEFAVLLSGCTQATEIRGAACRILSAMDRPFAYDGHTLLPSVTIGGALSGEDGTDTDTLRQNADFALYHAKETRRGGYIRFNDGLRTAMTRRLHVVRSVDEALNEKRIIAHYQPLIRLDTGRIVGLEALARMQMPDGRIASAGEFHEAMNDPKISCRLTTEMLGAIAGDMSVWRRAGLNFQHVGINITSADFQRGDLISRLVKIFERVDIPLSQIVLEITESVFLGNRNAAVARAIAGLRERGILVALDDFGTGYASLTHLLQYPVDIIKVDKSFIDGIGSGARGSVIVQAMITIAEQLGMKIIAEGIEHQHQAERLLAMGCNLGQGYHFARPAPADAIATLIRQFGQVADERPVGRPDTEQASAA